jgi:hypothetical protein
VGKTLVKIGHLGGTGGFFVKEKYLKNRRGNSEGILWHFVAGHGGDVWWVVHQFDDQGRAIGETAAVYSIQEFDCVANFEGLIPPGTDFLKSEG